jgi:hypothetical protein
MSSAAQNRILATLYDAMRPIAKFLLRAGISYREFADITKAAFVDVATSDYGIRGRPTNVSRVAVMTGLTRKEVKRLRERSSLQTQDFSMRRSPPAEVLHYWHTDKDYLNEENDTPKILSYDGDGVSFTSLVRLCAGDIPPGAMRTELKRVAAIIEHEDGSLEAVRRDHFPPDADSRLLQMIRFGLRPLASTIAFNSGQNGSMPTRFQRTVHSSQVRNEDLENYQKMVTQKLIKFSEELDDDLSGFESVDTQSDDNLNASNIGIGLFYFVDEE